MRVRLPFAPGLLLPPTIVIVLLAVVFTGTRVSNGVRAYVGGESLWSKAQKEGVAALYRYSTTRDEADYEAYRLAQRIPDADRRAREELQGPSPDPEVARLAFIEGGNHPADAVELVWIFRWFAWAPYFRDAIRIWGEADDARDELDVQAQALQVLIRSGTSTLEERRAMLTRIAEVDSRLTRLESDFSATIAAGARWVNRAGVLVVSATGLLLIVLGMLLMGRLGREQRRAIESERARAADRVHAEAALREREEQLRESQKLEAVGQLAGGVAHDFNNLLTVIQGNLELVRSAPEQDPELAEALDDALRAADRAAGLTAQLLTFSRRQVSQRRILQLNEIVSETRSMLQRVIGEGVRLATDLDATLPPVEGDPGQLSQVILNLVLNARDAMPKGGEILVRTHARPGWSVLEVVDTGEGMDEATRARIFEPFFTTKKVGKGTGLGLATVYGIVTALGGSIDVRSAPGQGSTFSIRLPAREWPDPGDDPIHEDDSADADEAILVVEDEPSVRALATRILEGRGFRVHTATNGEEALTVLADPGRPVQLVLSDVVMPEMGGRALSVAMRARGLRIPVLFMSGYTADADPLICPSGRPAQLLGKPFTPAELARRVRAVIDGA
ncbi:MAG: response regulator [Gemmatimonadales bacterium]|nr:response regulator [Gemmatimonadales bacterium]